MWFAVTTFLPAAGLAWLGWRMVEQERSLERQREQERREQAADLAAAALQRVMQVMESVTSAGGRPPGLFAVAVLDRRGLISRQGVQLPFYPLLPKTEMPGSLFLAAETEEFQGANLAQALHLLGPLARSDQPRIRAEALLRLARIRRKSGNPEHALKDFAQLGELDQATVGGIPAGLAARQGRALIFESLGRLDDLQREASALLSDLLRGKYSLPRSVYEMSVEQARKWGGVGEEDKELTASAAALEAIWREWTDGRPGGARRTLWVESQPVVAVLSDSGGRLMVTLAGSKSVERAWKEEMKSFIVAGKMDFALSDAEGRAVIGRPDAPAHRQSVRTASATRLPWTVHAISRSESAESQTGGRRTLLLLAVALMAILIVGGGTLVARALSREMRVARLQADFVSAVSHEFRTPITTMRQLSEMLVHGRVSTDARRAQFYETLLRESNRLHRLVEGLLNFGRMESGAARFNFEQVDVSMLVREVVSEFREEAAKSGFTVELDERGGPMVVQGDRVSLASVLWNLLDNAVKYSPNCRTVWVETGMTNGRAEVAVRDRGLGIPHEEQGEVFRKFVRGAASKTGAIQGTGIGLAMAKQIVEAHKGTIRLESESGAGSRFVILLPAVE